MTLSSAQGHSHAPPPTPAGQSTESPPATRLGRHRWWDLRFWIGVLLVVASVLVGARLLSAADRTVEVWQVRTDQSAGSTLDPREISAVRVHFDDERSAQRYLSADRELPKPAVLARDLGAGELLPVGAIVEGSQNQTLELPLVVPAAGFPSNLGVGDVVDVWTVPAEVDGRDGAQRILEGVAVIAVSSADFATATSDRSVVVALPSQAQSKRVLDDLQGREVVLLREGG